MDNGCSSAGQSYIPRERAVPTFLCAHCHYPTSPSYTHSQARLISVTPPPTKLRSLSLFRSPKLEYPTGTLANFYRAPVDRTTLQPGRRASKAGLESLRNPSPDRHPDRDRDRDQDHLGVPVLLPETPDLRSTAASGSVMTGDPGAASTSVTLNGSSTESGDGVGQDRSSSSLI